MWKDSSVEHPMRKLTATPPTPFSTAAFSLPGGRDSTSVRNCTFSHWSPNASYGLMTTCRLTDHHILAKMFLTFSPSDLCANEEKFAYAKLCEPILQLMPNRSAEHLKIQDELYLCIIYHAHLDNLTNNQK